MGKERGGEKTRESEREGRAAILHKGVNHPIFTAPSHSPQNGYFVPSCSQRHGGGAVGRRGRGGVGWGVGGMKTLLSHLAPPSPVPPLQLSHFSYSSTPLLCGFSVQQPFFFFFFFFFFTK